MFTFSPTSLVSLIWLQIAAKKKKKGKIENEMYFLSYFTFKIDVSKLDLPLVLFLQLC